jgi:hypothetical protein
MPPYRSETISRYRSAVTISWAGRVKTPTIRQKPKKNRNFTEINLANLETGIILAERGACYKGVNYSY